MLSEEFKKHYPFNSHYYQIDGKKYHYIDEGSGPVLLLMHGNPTWSFYYRNLIKHFSSSYRVICPDHIGCGFSDKPKDYDYCLKNHYSNVISLLNHLGINEFDMVVHDWGGAIGFGAVCNGQFNVNKVAVLNTAAFTDDNIPFSIWLCKIPVLGPFIVKQFNAFAWPATFMAVTRKLPKFIKKCFLLPYSSPDNRIAISEFVRDIPMFSGHKSWSEIKNIEVFLNNFKGQIGLFWGGKDFCFNDHFLQRWQAIFPKAPLTYYRDAGHYVLEDARGKIEEDLSRFFA